MIAGMREFEQVAAGLLDALRGRLGDETQEDLREFIDGGEEMLFVDWLAAALTLRRIPIVRTERDAVRDLLDFFEVDMDDEHYGRVFSFISDRDGTLAALNVVGEQ